MSAPGPHRPGRKTTPGGEFVKSLGRTLLCALFMLPATAMAGASGTYLDLFYLPNPEIEIDVSDPNCCDFTTTLEDGSGFGLRLRGALQDGLFIQGSYVATEFDTVTFTGDISGTADYSSEATELRAGVGFSIGDGPLYGLFEFIQQEIDTGESFDDSGFGAHIGVQGGERATFYAQVGYLDVGDFGDGIEFLIGGAIKVSDTVALFADYRNAKQDDGEGGEATITDLRAGARFHF
jgi:hypothetical protein